MLGAAATEHLCWMAIQWSDLVRRARVTQAMWQLRLAALLKRTHDNLCGTIGAVVLPGLYVSRCVGLKWGSHEPQSAVMDT